MILSASCAVAYVDTTTQSMYQPQVSARDPLLSCFFLRMQSFGMQNTSLHAYEPFFYMKSTAFKASKLALNLSQIA